MGSQSRNLESLIRAGAITRYVAAFISTPGNSKARSARARREIEWLFTGVSKATLLKVEQLAKKKLAESFSFHDE